MKIILLPSDEVIFKHEDLSKLIQNPQEVNKLSKFAITFQYVNSRIILNKNIGAKVNNPQKNLYRAYYDVEIDKYKVNEPLIYKQIHFTRWRMDGYHDLNLFEKHNCALYKDAIYHFDNSQDNFSYDEISLLIKDFHMQKIKDFLH